MVSIPFLRRVDVVAPSTVLLVVDVDVVDVLVDVVSIVDVLVVVSPELVEVVVEVVVLVVFSTTPALIYILSVLLIPVLYIGSGYPPV